MSDQVPGGKTSEVSDQPEKKDTVSYETYSKVLSEKKKKDQELSDYKARLDAIEQEKLEAQGKLKEALEYQKKQTQEFKDKNVKIVKDVTNKAIRSQFLRESEKLGCVDPELAMAACSFEDVDVDADTFELDSQKLVQKLQELTKAKPFLFKKDVKVPPDFNPSHSSQNSAKSLSELSEQELKNLLRTAK